MNLLSLIPLRTWLIGGLAVSLLFYHIASLENAKHRVRVEVDAQWQTKIDAANKQAQADHDSQQAKIDELAKASQPEIAKKFDSLKAQIASLESSAKKPPKVFASNCVLQVEQVEAFNAIH